MPFVTVQRGFMALKIELVYIAQNKSSFHITMELPEGSLVRDALVQSHVYESHPETQELPVGIYGKLVTVDATLKNGDRIELYRHLTLDPKEKRRRLASVKPSRALK